MAAGEVTQAMVDFYRIHGAVKLPGLISRKQAASFREEGMKLLLAGPTGELDIDGANQQRVQLWKWNETMRELTMLPRLGAAAERLAGMPLRLWHDDIIAKPPKNEGPTRPHQDMPLWALGNAPGALTAWIALQDTSVEMGCMSFAMGSQHWKDLPKEVAHGHRPDIAKGSLQNVDEVAWLPRITIPLQAGDCTFHNGYTFHMAGPNLTDEWRVAHRVAMVDAAAVYDPHLPHPVIDDLGLDPGDGLPDRAFPLVSGWAGAIDSS